MQLKRNISYKIYEVSIIVTAVFCLLNIAGVWVTWCLNNPLGYIFGSLLILCLALDAVVSFFNEREAIRKFWIVWLIMFVLHVTFFIICAVLVNTGSGNQYAIPALFTVMLVCIMGGVMYAIFRKKFINKNKPYKITPTTVEEGKDQTAGDGEIIQPTKRIEIKEDEDKKPQPVFDNNEHKSDDKSDDETPTVSTGVITL